MILGIYHPAQGMGHDTGLGLIEPGGRILAAHCEERFSRVKMDGGFPFRAFEALRRIIPFSPSDLSCVAVPFMSPAQKVSECGRLAVAALRDPRGGLRHLRDRLDQDQFQKGMARIGAYAYEDDYRRQLLEVRDGDGRPRLAGWREFLDNCGLGKVPVVHVDHHAAHAAGAYYTSGWDEALLITCDGVGALKSGIVAVGRAGRLRVLARTFYPHSPGQFWEAVTAICGFHHMKHGGKITGLAAHGNSEAACYQVMREALGLVGLTIRSAVDPVRMAQELREAPREDIAATAQRRLEEVVVELVRRAVRSTGVRRVALAGGVFANVRLNQAIGDAEEVEEVYVYPAMGDEGLGLGAALYAAGARGRLLPVQLTDLYLGPGYSESEIEAALRETGFPYTRHGEAELADLAAARLARGEVIGLFRGRMEFGPRALGHRSILHQTTDARAIDWLNKRLARTEFMPFAPVTLDEHAARCYEGISRRRSAARFMTVTVPVTDWMRRVSPGVVHLDGSARPQLITRDAEPFYSDVLSRYAARTGIPSLINTSFNIHEEPIVCDPRDALRAFRLGRLDSMVIGSFLVTAARA